MKRFSLCIVIPFSLIFFVGCKMAEKPIPQKPNIIFIMLDDFGYSEIAYNSENISENDYDPLFLDLTLKHGHYSPDEALGFSREATPTLSRMAKEGAMFTNAFSPSNLCSPSRLGIATGVLPNRWGIYRNIDSEAHGPKPGSLLIEKLTAQGYATAHIGKWHLGSRDQRMVTEFFKKHGIKDSAGIYPPVSKFPEVQKDLNQNGYMGSVISEHHALNNGFDYYFGYNHWQSPFYNANNVWDGFEHAGKNSEYNTDLFTDKAVKFIENSIEQDKPFYVQLHFHAVHSPLVPRAPDKYFNKFDSESFILNNFYAHVFAVDENVKRLENFLKEKGKAENTIFVFTSDNGGALGGHHTMPGNAPFRGHKGMYLLGGIKVPLFFYWPEGIKTPVINNQLASALDILPTVIDAAGMKPPDTIDGKSLLPLLKNDSDETIHDYLIWSGIHSTAWGFMNHTNLNTPSVSREMAPYAWVVIKDNYVLRYIAETKKGYYKDIPEGTPGFYELYDLESDPGERINLLREKHRIFSELKSIWEEEAKSFPPPKDHNYDNKLGKEKWEKIVPENNKYLKNQ